MNYSLTAKDMPQLASWIGFDRIFDEMLNPRQTRVNNWPPHNLVKVDDTNYYLEFAVAGFSENEIDVTTKESKLVIRGGKEKVEEETDDIYLHRGIAQRSFENSFNLADDVIVTNASLVNGLLKIYLEKIVPEEKQLRTIKIETKEAIGPGSGSKQEFLTEDAAA